MNRFDDHSGKPSIGRVLYSLSAIMGALCVLSGLILIFMYLGRMIADFLQLITIGFGGLGIGAVGKAGQSFAEREDYPRRTREGK